MDIKSIGQLVAYVRFVKKKAIVDEFLFCQEMKERTRAKNVFDLVNTFLQENLIAWNTAGSVCTNGAPAMIRHQSGFVALMKQVAPHMVSNHCAINKYALACMTLPLELKSVLDSVVKAVNFIRGRAVNSRLFKAFCDDLGKEHQYLLFHTQVQWLSRGKVLSRVAELVKEVAVFLREHGSVELATLFDDNRFQLKVFYLADIFSLLNELSYSLQGKNKSQIEAAEKVSAFKKKLSLGKKRVRNQNLAMFLLLDSKIGDQETNEWLTAIIEDHISNLKKKMEDYFPTSEPSSAWNQQPFIAEINDNKLLNLHEQHLELQSSQAAKTKFSSSSLIELWCSMLQEYSELAKRALEALIPFPTTHLCEAAMSALVDIITTYRNCLRVANDMRIVLSNINPRIDELISKRQVQRSH